MHAHRHTLVGVLTDREQLHDTVHLAGGSDVGRGHLGDALAVDVGTGHPGVERERGQDGGLRCCVEPLDVGRRVSLGVAQRLRLLDGVVETGPGGVHPVEDEVGRPVDDAEHPGDLVTGQRLAQALKHRRHLVATGLVVEVDSVLGRCGVEGGPVVGEQRLVRGHDRGTVLHRAQDERPGGFDPPDHLDHDVGARHELVGVGGEQRRVDPQSAAITPIAPNGNADDLDRAADASGHVVGVLGEKSRHRTADDTGAEQGDPQRLGRAHFSYHERILTCVRVVDSNCFAIRTASVKKRRQTSSAMMSSMVSRRTMSRAAPPCTATTGGRGVWLYWLDRARQ